MTATAFIGSTAAMIAPYRITQVQGAGIGNRANHRAAHRAGSGAKCGVTCSSTDSGTAGGTKQSTTRGTITRVRAATRDEKGRRET
ncbi:MAG TPA: hypothetical protein VN175_04865 [Rhizomicrobium sp.]|nr:hypothetical protein [Rhizomicrobium sp.]